MRGAWHAVCLIVLLGTVGHIAAGVVEDANEAMTRAFQAESPAPVLAARNLSILHLAMHDAVEAGRAGRKPWLRLPAVKQAPNPEAAAREAALVVCQTLYPGRSGDFATLTSADAVTPELKASLATGRSVAAAWLEARRDDGASTTIHYVPQEAPGQWRRTPPANRPPEMPHWGRVKPFAIQSAEALRPQGPPALDAAEYAPALEEVRHLGSAGSMDRTPDQTEIAKFWADFSYTTTPPGHWNEITRTLARARGLSLRESARLFTLLNVAMADTGIAVWDCKYHWNAWRPVTAIQSAGDKNWMPLLATPPHPEYVSGHSAFSAAAAAVLKEFFGTDAVTFSVSSDTLPGVQRRFTGFTTCAREVGRSRVFGGIHFQFSNEAGQKLGERVAGEVLEKR